MPTIFELKEQSTTETPLFVIRCEFVSGAEELWSTHRVEIDGEVYAPRVIQHNLFEIRSDSEAGIDSLSKVNFTLANADSHCSQVERSVGFKGAKVTVRFLFFDLKSGKAASESTVVFRGIANPPDDITASTLRLTISNRLNLQRQLLPDVRIQRRCPWKFPSNAGQRAEAAAGGAKGVYSPLYRCGYSPNAAGGAGNMNEGVPYASCDYTKGQCEERGMFSTDSLGNPTRRFGGMGFVPPATLVRSHGERAFHLSTPVENEARYNDFVPIVYGTGWYSPPIVFARNDGNLTRMEVLLGMGEVHGVLKVLVNNIEVPEGRSGADMTATGWYNLVSAGDRTGTFNPDFRDAAGNPIGDPYGSMAVLSVVVPNRINDGRVLPRIEVLLQGLKLARYSEDGTPLEATFSNNPAWVILDILRRSGWDASEINLESFARTAAYCEEYIEGRDLYGNPVQLPRFQCNLVLRKRRSVAELIRGVRNACRVHLILGGDGRLELRTENGFELQQPDRPPWSNSQEEMQGGWPYYDFGDGALGSSGILRKESGEPAIRRWSRGTADTPNRFSVEFQDAFNEYQQDSLSLVDVDDALKTGQEVSVSLNALGIPNCNQAARIIQLQLEKSIRGNTYLEFETSVRGVGLRPGDLITLTYLKEGFQRQPFRIKSIAPGLNYQTATILAQIHSDTWYTDEVRASAGSSGAGRQPGVGVGLPRPLLGSVLDEEGEPQFDIQERVDETTQGVIRLWLTVGFVAPGTASSLSGRIPMVGLSPVVSDTGGTLAGDTTFYYAVSAVGPDGGESPLSFIVRATIPPGTNSNTVRLVNLSFAPSTTSFHVYRGTSPIRLFRIASNHPVAAEFADPGLEKLLESPPDEDYDHANFYWRFELQPEHDATIRSAATIGNDTLEMPTNEHQGMVVRITKGKGAGQERAVLSNDSTTLTLATVWSVEPDATSRFVIAESGWRPGASGRTSPVEFEVPIRVGRTVQISGRSANVHNKECAYELSPLTRWRLGSGSGTRLDSDVPGRPVFGLNPARKGTVELMGVGFHDLVNTRTVAAGTLSLYYWNELTGPAGIVLVNTAGAPATTLYLSKPHAAQPEDLVQVGREIMKITEVFGDGEECTVVRGFHGTTAVEHEAGTLVYPLTKGVFVIPFARDFFGSPSSGSFSYRIVLPDVRIASAELVATNMHGNSEPSELNFTSTIESGLRSLSGGQLSIQVQGYLAVQSDVAPPLVIEESHSARDVFAVVREAPAGAAVELQLRQDDEPYCRLTIAAGSTISNIVSGFGLPLLQSGSQISMDILSVGLASAGSPGRDLTVTIRL